MTTFPTERTIRVLDHGYVQLLDWMGDDLAIVQAAQASFDKQAEVYTSTEERILQFLMREEHGVPFEHVVLKFGMRMPLKFAAQFKKHRMSSWSERSSRYDEMDDLCYVPERFRRQVGKIGSYTFEDIEDGENELARSVLQKFYRQTLATYNNLLAAGIAKEQASLVLPVGLYTSVVWTINVRSLFNVIHLRADSHAQGEAQEYAKAFEALAYLVIPDTIRMFIEAGRPKP